jgi:hypothetical protein
MANEEHLKILKQGVDVWNQWRKENPKVCPDLCGADLSYENLGGMSFGDTNPKMEKHIGVNLDGANLCEANLLGAILSGANLNSANLRRAKLLRVNLSQANLCKTNLEDAELMHAYLYKVDLSRANLSNTNLTYARLIETNFEKANLTGCKVYGVSAWGLKLKDAIQTNLVITPDSEPTITVDNLEVAQFIYLLLYNEKIRHVIDTITSKVVLILGRFTDERKKVLEAIKEQLRKHDYLPVMFDFPPSDNRDLTETINILGRLAKFVIVDITDPRSVPQELQAIVPHCPSVPIQPILQASTDEYGMFEHFKNYPWVLKVYRYDNSENLLASLEKQVIIPAEAKVKELLKLKRERDSCEQ